MAKGPKTALVPVKGVSFDEEAVELACELVRPSKGMVWVLYVIEIPRTLPLDAEVPAETIRGEQVLQRMEQLGRVHRCKVEGEILQARGLGAAVVREAEERRVDLVVTGMPYIEDYGAPTMGDFVPFLLKHCPAKVLVLREEQGAMNRDGRQR